MTVVACTDFPEPESLKEILEELAKLHNSSSTKSKVFLKLKSYLNTYCGNGYLEAFYQDRDHGRGSSSSSGSIQLLTLAGEGIGRELLQNPTWADRYVDPHEKHSGKDCGEKYFNALKECLPELFPALLFLFFNCDSGCKGFGGGSWSSYSVKDSGQNLNKWLTDQDGSGLITRGFLQKDLNTSNTGQNVATALKKAVSLKPDTDSGSLQKVLCGFMFVCSWDDASLLGHAICFLYKFCSEVSQGPESFLKGPYKDHSGAFKDVCKGLQTSLEPFIDGSSGLSAVCHGNTNLFDTLWDDGKFDKYCTWLKGNLHYIIGSLKAMSGESSQWSSDHLMSAASAGPFKYGFVFNTSWKDSTSMSKLQGYISKLTGEDSGSLKSLQDCLNGKSPAISERLTTATTQSSSGAAAAGAATGVISLGGAGFGAAYGFNLFGLKDIMSGVFGAIRGLVVGF